LRALEEGKEERENEVVGWHHLINGHEFEQRDREINRVLGLEESIL